MILIHLFTVKFQVKFFDFKGNNQISLVETTDTNPLENDTVLITSGNKQAGNMYYSDGTTWKLAQDKTESIKQPLFDLYDDTGVSFADRLHISNSDSRQ